MFVCFLIIKNIDCEKPCGDEPIKCVYVLRHLSPACKITGIHVIIVFSDHLCTNLCKSHNKTDDTALYFVPLTIGKQNLVQPGRSIGVN